jgi:hypothetical protein
MRTRRPPRTGTPPRHHGREPLALSDMESLLFVTTGRRPPACSDSLSRANGFGIPALFGFDIIHGLRTISRCRSPMAASLGP